MTDTIAPEAPVSPPVAASGPVVTTSEHKAFLLEIEEAIYDEVLPKLSVPAAWIAEELKRTSDLELAKIKASYNWVRSKAYAEYVRDYTRLKASWAIPEAGLVSGIVGIGKASFWDRIEPYAHRLSWGFYGAVIAVGLMVAFGPHPGA